MHHASTSARAAAVRSSSWLVAGTIRITPGITPRCPFLASAVPDRPGLANTAHGPRSCAPCAKLAERQGLNLGIRYGYFRMGLRDTRAQDESDGRPPGRVRPSVRFNDPAAMRAWQAFEEGRLEDSEREWSRLIAGAEGRRRDSYRRSYGYLLVSQGRFEEARNLYRGLFEQHGNHEDLHQVGMVEREAGRLTAALEVFGREAALIEETNALGRAANLFELALVHHLLGDHHASAGIFEECLEAAEASEDPIMLAAAYRLKGDTLAASAPEQARAAYEISIQRFEQAGDKIGAGEVRQRVEDLEQGDES